MSVGTGGRGGREPSSGYFTRRNLVRDLSALTDARSGREGVVVVVGGRVQAMRQRRARKAAICSRVTKLFGE